MNTADLTFTRSGELDVTQVQGNTDRGIAFVDAWIQNEMVVVDANRIIVREMAPMEAAIEFEGLTVERIVVASERPSAPVVEATLTSSALFDSLKRGVRYTFVFGDVTAVFGVFHEIMPDGTLRVAGTLSGKVREYRINPDRVIYARVEES